MSFRIWLLAITLCSPQVFAQGLPSSFPSGPVTLENEVIRLRTFRAGIDSPQILTELYEEQRAETIATGKEWDYTLETCAARFTGITPGQSMKQDACQSLRLLIERKADGKITGMIGFSEYENGQFEIGYRMTASHRRQGLTSTAVQLIINEIKKVNPYAEIIAWTRPENTASRRLLAKNGFAFQYEDSRPLCLHILESQL